MERLNARRVPYSSKLSVCSRAGDVLEPMLREQWFMKCADLGQATMRAIDDG